MGEAADIVRGGDAGDAERKQAREAGVASEPAAPAPVPIVELHVCMGLNSCRGHGVAGTAPMAGMGTCSTVFHACHGDNECRGQGGCGYAGSEYEQTRPGAQDCKYNGSCASPINVSRVTSGGPNKGKSVWQLARQIFEARMYSAGIPFGPSPAEGYPDDLVPPGSVV